MNIYVAGPWLDREEVKGIADRIAKLGHKITHPWWEHEGEYDDAPLMKAHAAQDWAGVVNAVMVVVCDFRKSEGKAVEQGIALAYGKPILMLHKDGVNNLNIFHNLGNYKHFHTEEALLDYLRDERQW